MKMKLCQSAKKICEFLEKHEVRDWNVKTSTAAHFLQGWLKLGQFKTQKEENFFFQAAGVIQRLCFLYKKPLILFSVFRIFSSLFLSF